MVTNHQATETLISLNMNIGLLLCLVSSAGLSASSVSKYERNIGAKSERVRRTAAGAIPLSLLSGIVGLHNQIPGTLTHPHILIYKAECV